MHPVPLAQVPTPLEALLRTSIRLGTEIWIKRDDLTGFALSGNKVRKLAYLLAEALSQGADTVVTCGGIQSNHCRATAVAARKFGLHPVLLLRGDNPEIPEANLLLDRLLGAEIHTCDSAGYAVRDEKMAELAAELRARGRRPYVIPEGGSNALGALAFAEAGRELSRQCVGLRFDTILCATGSGGTLAGLAMAGLDARIVGVAVCDDRAIFRSRVLGIATEAQRYDLKLPEDPEQWDVLEGFQGKGYALSRPEEWQAHARFAQETGIVLDPVYTGKAWYALESTLAREPFVWGARVLFWHTGGTFGLFGRGQELVEAGL